MLNLEMKALFLKWESDACREKADLGFGPISLVFQFYISHKTVLI